MNKKELVSALADMTGNTKVDADRNIEALLKIIGNTLKKGDKITLADFGVFETRKRAARIGHNPRTGQKIKIVSVRIAAFKTSTALKAELNDSN